MAKPRLLQKPAARGLKVHRVGILSDGAGLCGAGLFSSAQMARDWKGVTCDACLARKPQKPVRASLSDDELDVALDALRVWAERERDLAMHDCWGDGPGQRKKRAAYDARIAVADALAARLGKSVR